jgi:hypothetical protein
MLTIVVILISQIVFAVLLMRRRYKQNTLSGSHPLDGAVVKEGFFEWPDGTSVEVFEDMLTMKPPEEVASILAAAFLHILDGFPGAKNYVEYELERPPLEARLTGKDGRRILFTLQYIEGMSPSTMKTRAKSELIERAEAHHIIVKQHEALLTEYAKLVAEVES